MTEERGPTGPQFHADRPQEQEAVRTTIVGGRPPGSGQSIGNIPRGIEVLVKKASVDPAFKAVLLDRRAEAADEIGLHLEPAEALMLAAAPREQLESVIANTHVPEEHRRTFLGKVAAAMLIAVGGIAVGSLFLSAGTKPRRELTKGISPDRPPPKEIVPEPPPKEKAPPPPSKDARPHQWPKPAASRDEPLKEGTIFAGIGPERSLKHDPSDSDQSGKSPSE